jgi:hypothetical protein
MDSLNSYLLKCYKSLLLTVRDFGDLNYIKCFGCFLIGFIDFNVFTLFLGRQGYEF